MTEAQRDSQGTTATVEELRAEIESLRTQLEVVGDSERRYRTLVESAKDYIFIVDRGGIVRYVNEFGASALRMTPSQAVGRPLRELFPANADRQADSIGRVISTGKPVYTETVTRFPSGSIWLDTWLIPIRNRHNEIDRVLGVSRDTTERRRAVEELEHRIAFEDTIAGISRRFISAPIEGLDEAIGDGVAELGLFLGADAGCVRIVPVDGVETSYAWSREGEEPEPAFESTTREWFSISAGMRPPRAVIIDDVNAWPAGAQAMKSRLEGVLSLALVPLVFAHEVVGVLVYLSRRADVVWSSQTESLIGIAGEIFANALMRRRVEQERIRMASELARAEQLDSIGILAGGIAHDFNNILAAVMGNVSLAKAELARYTQACSRLNEAEKALGRARDLTQQLLTFAKGGSPVKQLVDVGLLATEAAVFATRGSNVRPMVEVEPDLWPVEADTGQIAQVVHNLVLNAEQAMEDGGTVEVAAENITLAKDSGIPLAPGNYVRITVSDDGPGIDPEHLPLIFVPYFTTKSSGTGLGLATSYNIVRKHAGLITVDSTVGEGANFSVFLPAADGARRPEARRESSLKMGHGRVLVVDDDESVRSSCAAMLVHLGYEPGTAGSGEEAVALYRRAAEQGRPFAAVIMDLTLPGGINGKVAFEQIRTFDREARAVVSSGYSEDPVMGNHAEHGFASVLKKPYGIRQLGEVLAKVVPRG